MNSTLQTLRRFLLPVGKASLTGVFMLIVLSAPAWATHKIPAQAPAVLTVSVSSATVCAGASTTLTANGCPATGAIRWSTAQAGTSITVVPQQTTTYTALCNVTSTSVTTTTATSTSAASTTALVTTVTTTTATATVQVYPPIVLTPTSLSALCNGSRDGQVAINARGGTGTLQYQFNGQGYQTTNTAFGNLPGGVYAVSVRDGLGCVAQANVEVKQPPALAVSVTPVNPKCSGGSDGGLIAVASGGVGDYRYFLDGGPLQISGTFISLSGNTTYRLGVADKNNCVLFQPVAIGAPTSISITLTTRPARCAGSADGSVAVTVAGGAGTYQYQIGTGPFQTGTQFTGLAANNYEITVQDNLGCQGKQTAVVGQPAPVQLTAVARPVNCFGPASGSLTLTATGGTGAVQYRLSTSQTPQASNVFTGLAIGNYTVLATDANGCTGVVSATVTQANPLDVQATATAATCCVCPTGAVNLVSTGGSGTVRQYQILGQPAQSAGLINGLRPNTYRFVVVDEAGCTDSVAAVVTDGNALTLTSGMIKDVSCAGGNNGEATVQVAGGKRPFTFYWATERRDTLKTFTATQTMLTEGTYTVSVLDSNRCSTTTVFVPIKATFPLPTKPAITQAGSSTLLVTDGPAGIQWYFRIGTAMAGQPIPNATGSALVPYESGQYYVVVTANGCASPPSDPINFILTALADPGSGLSVRVVPNPVVDRLRVEIEQVDRSAVTVQLLDASGRAVMSGQIPAFSGKKGAEWPLTGLSTGSYLLRVSAESRQSVLRVLVE